MNTANNKILVKMLERLMNSLMNGPSLNCRPHSSRQRIDWMQLAKLQDKSPETCLLSLLGSDRKFEVKARVPAPARQADRFQSSDKLPQDDRPEENPAEKAWNEQRACVNKLRSITEDAKTYEQDTGVHVLSIGYPLLTLPPGSFGSKQRNATRRIVAPIAFIPVSVTVKAGAVASIEVTTAGDGIDLVVPNAALMAWLEQQTGKRADAVFLDEDGENPWREIMELVAYVGKALGIQTNEILVPPDTEHGSFSLKPSPRRESDDSGASILPSAVLGLFPLANQGLLRDMQAMVAGEETQGPIESFVSVAATLESKVAEADHHDRQPKSLRKFTDERLITAADPCQVRAVKLAQSSRGLVIHGPPGTGKSQTITNIIGDHLSRGERVLVVCDKRTALDVVINRLEAAGIRELCADVHDPQRDQVNLYRSIRTQLEALPEAQTHPRLANQLEKANVELQEIHANLSQFHNSLSEKRADDGLSFHDCVGQWFGIDETPPDGQLGELLSVVRIGELDQHVRDIREILERGQGASYSDNRWVQAAGVSLSAFLGMPMDAVRERMNECLRAAKHADSTLVQGMPPFREGESLGEQGRFLAQVGEKLSSTVANCRIEFRQYWSAQTAKAVTNARQQLAAMKAHVDTFRESQLDAELALLVRTELPSLTQLNADLTRLAEYRAIADKWFAFLKFGIKKEAKIALSRFGLAVNGANAERAERFLKGLRARMMLSDLHQSVLTKGGGQRILDDELLASSISEHEFLFDLLSLVHANPKNATLVPEVAKALTDTATSESLIELLAQAPARAEAIEKLCVVGQSTKLLDEKWVVAIRPHLCKGTAAAPTFEKLIAQLPLLEHVLRVRDGLAALPDGLRNAVRHLLAAGFVKGRSERLLRKSALANTIGEHIRSTPNLQAMDDRRVQSLFERYRDLEQTKPSQVQKQILDLWRTRQQERLLTGTGSRMNSLGAEVRRRLVMRGPKCLRLRQVVALGEMVEGGDPLFDLRPVWMASPETVAQLFPRKDIFDAVIFDEASQCRLEEALPVLTRAKRVVIAGDPKQLPPTRFFESTVAASEDDDVETAQDLFETQQSDVEDLLTAALNLDIQECYLDVHYRSRNSDLIEFSNDQFYESRLQPIPGHPANRTRYAPITLYNVGGVYDKRANIREADEVCRIVRDLLRRAEPPSIGIACFNITQRDLISERLDLLAEQDGDFSKRLDAARHRLDRGASAHLFVKNLENVQGDERDHIIVSTTYGPDPAGKFYQRFGPIGRAGGGRRLNVLVTRAREELHLVSSIPPGHYRNLPPIPAGQSAGGGWLLYAYLKYAEELRELYEQAHSQCLAAQVVGEPRVMVRPTRHASPISESLAETLARKQGFGSTVYWGNDGFCVDLALQHPKRAEDVTIGVLCDSTRYTSADDPIEWEIFRSSILESQGWKLHRIWSPHFFRDVQGSVSRIVEDVHAYLKGETDRDAIPVKRDA